MNQQQHPPLTVSVISPQLCSLENDVELTVVEDDDSKLVSAKDADGNIIFHIKDDEHKVIHKQRRVLLDDTGNPLVTLQGKLRTRTHKRWEAFRRHSKNSKDLLFRTERPSSSSFQIPTKLLEVFLETNDTKDICDFKVTGSWSERSCTFYTGESNIIIAKMTKTPTGTSVTPEKETFTVTVDKRVDYAFVVALIVILDAINDDDKNSKKKNKENGNRTKKQISGMNFVAGAVNLVGAALNVAGDKD